MQIDILTLFPEMFEGPFDTSMLKKAQDKSLVDINIHDLRKWASDKHKSVDDRPYGGGKGMVLMIQPIYDALESLKFEARNSKSETNYKLQITNYKKKSILKSQLSKVLLLSPQGKVFTQQKVKQLSKLKHIILVAGHYEGFDERIREHLVDEEISIGDYVLTGGEIPAMVVVDSIVRLLPGVLEKKARENESFQSSIAKGPTFAKASVGRQKSKVLLDYPQYTRPENFKGWKVPEVLLSGNHAEIEKWRKKKALEITKKKRPDLLKD